MRICNIFRKFKKKDLIPDNSDLIQVIREFYEMPDFDPVNEYETHAMGLLNLMELKPSAYPAIIMTLRNN